MPAVAEGACTESKHGLCAISAPAHASVSYVVESRFWQDSTVPLLMGRHTPSIFPQIGDRLFDCWRRLCEVRIETQDATKEEVQLTVS